MIFMRCLGEQNQRECEFECVLLWRMSVKKIITGKGVLSNNSILFPYLFSKAISSAILANSLAVFQFLVVALTCNFVSKKLFVNFVFP